MNKAAIVSSIISGIVGLAVGSGSVVLYYKKIQENYNVELDNSRAMINELQNKLKSNNDDIKSELLNHRVTFTKPVELPSANEYKEVVESIDNSDSESTENKSPVIGDGIRYISPEDYEDDDDDFEKAVIKYYSKDGVLTQGDYVLSKEEFEECCGVGPLNSFGAYGAPSNTCYVRNENFVVDYEIKRYNMSYQSYKNSLK